MTGEFDPPRHLVREAVARAIAEDLGSLGDVTAALVPAGAGGPADLVARADGVLAGTACAVETYAQLDPAVTVRWSAGDGDVIGKGQAIARLEGPLRSLLTGERTALNFLCHLSGVATATSQFVAACAPTGGHARIWETRKTLPGLRGVGEGRGARRWRRQPPWIPLRHGAGQGQSPRWHVDLGARSSRLVSSGRAGGSRSSVTAGPRSRKRSRSRADLVMLDNMTPDEVRDCVAIVRASDRPETLVEVSGGVTLENVAAYAAAGADLISASGITQSAPALDIGLDLALE